MAKTFEDGLLDELAAIPWLDGPTGRGFVGAIGRAQDAEVRNLKDAVLMAGPADAPADALPYIGLDRGILKAPVETDQAYALRLDKAHDIRTWDGTKTGFIGVFEPYGLTSAKVAAYNNHEIVWDGNAEWFSRAFVLIDSPTGPWTTDGIWDADGSTWEEEPATGTWDSSATTADLAYIRASVLSLKSSHAYPVTIAVNLGTRQLADGYWDSPGIYDDGGAWSEDGSGGIGAASGEGLYWTIGHVWGEEEWLGGSDVWADGPAEAGAPIEEHERWEAYVDE